MLYIKEGFGILRRHPLILLIFFLYQWAWAFVLYKGVHSVVVPLLQRFPGEALPEQASRLFLAEGQFILLKTDAAHGVLWSLLVVLSIRMIITPLLNAGLYHCIEAKDHGRTASLWQGMRSLGPSFTLIYAIQTVCILAPIYWLAKLVKEAYHSASSYTDLLWTVLPWLLGYIIYIFIVKILFMYIMFGKAAHKSPFYALGMMFKHLLPALLVSLLIALFVLATVAASSAITFIWAGFLSIVLHQLYQFIKTLLKLWEITSQYAVWRRN